MFNKLVGGLISFGLKKFGTKEIVIKAAEAIKDSTKNEFDDAAFDVVVGFLKKDAEQLLRGAEKAQEQGKKLIESNDKE